MKPILTILLMLSPALAIAAEATKPTKPLLSLPYESALRGYRNFADEPIADWRATNDTVARIGGWRAYIKESFQARQRDVQPGPAGVGK